MLSSCTDDQKVRAYTISTPFALCMHTTPTTKHTSRTAHHHMVTLFPMHTPMQNHHDAVSAVSTL